MTKKPGILNYGLTIMTVGHTLTHVFSGIHTTIFNLALLLNFTVITALRHAVKIGQA